MFDAGWNSTRITVWGVIMEASPSKDGLWGALWKPLSVTTGKQAGGALWDSFNHWGLMMPYGNLVGQHWLR